MRLPFRPELQGVAPYGAPHPDVPVVLNVNENPYAPSDAVVAEIAAAVAHAATGLNRYPDRDFRELRAALAAYLQREAGVALPGQQLWAANGSNEVMTHLFLAFGGPGRSAISFTPTYSMYPEYARDTHTSYYTAPRDPDYRVDLARAQDLLARHRPSLLVLASPNNPTGTAQDLALTRQLLEATRASGPRDVDGAPTATVVVIDEAYGEFRRAGTPSALTLLADYEHLVVTRTMSKAFGAAGLRLGYCAAAAAIIDALTVVRLPYHLSAITQAAALAALKHQDSLMSQVAALRAERDALVDWLRAEGLDALDSDANFVLFGPLPEPTKVFTELLARGIIIRQVGPAGYLRVTVGTPTEMAAFKAALKESM
ncbi:histidinol-phosphate transaminase [Buchananella hordeovulneris]|uniref:Histidinol-phosphate aminotransferase n=1 Tax=Buchananella hordeovulneris TaxID=52770 RepID=A0A1Q5PVM7_9ACTO|nr:histidinol-phosphate transaminase [Buchananella hordeovulneris]MDO5080604.1 histidinol-phosphate transaminase [Buchananella hordeovulneris]OKL51617.1 histidinol-phosphate transaminase [Buchananella hordeovulneris]RRD44098.1 histidinol-phosphate transaminase [Buchananella hordeovulneris]RRD53659.1 histidinol-phosphate transaminase [Buchananella hordeovulneris]